MPRLSEGDKAPGFNVPDSDMAMVDLAEFSGSKVLLYFYPKDDTPGCTVQATDFTDRIEEFNELDVVILGVSRDDCISHQAFRDKYGLQVRLLSDVDSELCEAYGVLQLHEETGKIKLLRSSFLIDEGGVLRHAEYGVAPKGQADHLLDLLRSWN